MSPPSAAAAPSLASPLAAPFSWFCSKRRGSRQQAQWVHFSIGGGAPARLPALLALKSARNRLPLYICSAKSTRLLLQAGAAARAAGATLVPPQRMRRRTS